MEYARKTYNLILKTIEYRQDGLMSKTQDTDIMYIVNILNCYNFIGITDSQKLRLESELNRITNNIVVEGFFDEYAFEEVFN